MVPIELVWFIIVLLFGLIGIVRGYLRELGVTTVMVVALYGIITFEGRVMPLVLRFLPGAGSPSGVAWQSWLWTVGLIFAAFISYHGDTLAFQGKQPSRGTLAVFLNCCSGLVNGYLIAGGIWFYLDRLNYPLLPMTSDNLSGLAKQLLLLMPQNLLGSYLLVVAIFLVLMRVVR